jgi:ligand-binding sensor domain-containing protein
VNAIPTQAFPIQDQHTNLITGPRVTLALAGDARTGGENPSTIELLKINFKMKKYYFLKHGYTLVLFVLLLSCNRHVNTNNTIAPTTTTVDQPKNKPFVHEFLFISNANSINAPSSITRNVMQDRNKKYWFATWEGIICYDGKQFTNVSQKEKLGQFRVFSLLEDKSGNLWFGTINAGLYRYDGQTFKHFTKQDGLPNNSVLSMLEDRDGSIWFGTEEGVSHYVGKSFINFTTQDGVNGNINSIVQDKSGKLWFGTRYGVNGDLICYDGKSYIHFKNKKGVPFSNVRTIIEDKSGTIWIGGNDGLISYDGKSFTSISTNFIGYIFEDKIGNLWLSEDEPNGWALNKYDGKSKTKIDNNSMIFGSTQDTSGNIWYGTMDGVRYFDGKTVNQFQSTASKVE